MEGSRDEDFRLRNIIRNQFLPNRKTYINDVLLQVTVGSFFAARDLRPKM